MANHSSKANDIIHIQLPGCPPLSLSLSPLTMKMFVTQLHAFIYCVGDSHGSSFQQNKTLPNPTVTPHPSDHVFLSFAGIDSEVATRQAETRKAD